jgi:hypothetical protein
MDLSQALFLPCSVIYKRIDNFEKSKIFQECIELYLHSSYILMARCIIKQKITIS